MIVWFRLQWEWIRSRLRRDLRVQTMEGFDMPATIAQGVVLRLTVNGEDWLAGMQCPCQCGDVIELMLLKGVHPRWDFKVDRLSRPTLSPSVFRATGCRSHFWIRAGQITWCD